MKIRGAVVLGFLLVAAAPTLHAQCQPVLVSEKIHPAVATVIHGSVQNNAGQLVAGLSVTIKGSEKPAITKTVVTDDHGQFTFDSVPAGKYTLIIERTAGTAKRTELMCDTNGVCQVEFILRPPRKPGDCPVVDHGAMQNGLRQ